MGKSSILIFLLLLPLVAGCGEPEGIGADWKRVEPPVAAPGFSLLELDRGQVSLADYRGQVVIVEFWATWCSPCRFSTPSLDAVYRRHRDRGVAVLLVNASEKPEKIRTWADDRFAAPILLDPDGRVRQAYGVRGLPHLVVVDQTGHLVYVHHGYRGGLERNLELILEELIMEPVGDA